jgi:hypothetical protein
VAGLIPNFVNYRLLFEALDREPLTDAGRIAEIAEFEARWHCRVPASLREWFSFAPATVAGCWPSAALTEVEAWQPRDGNRHELPQRLYLLRHDGDVCSYVPLDGTDDPPVNLVDLAWQMPPPREQFAPTFSRAVLFWGLQGKWDYWSRAQGVPFHPAAWDDLHERFRVAESPGQADGGSLTFVARGGIVRLGWEHGNPRVAEVRAHWSVCARTPQAFLTLAHAVALWVDLLHPAEYDRSPLAGEALR